ncbi:hypothetical protein GCHA_4720 [Paraglaciecola chathamensis S18K6]|uniref:Uncharacterized protein n=1 Tax=Paraglaciecola chathamensis S18K6 TaxID=1127672 RepID=A0AAV3V7E5_9ALTE|nr:hypothetical protein GCHA_4720 [Paraglaciecola chathamensis S18K6]
MRLHTLIKSPLDVKDLLSSTNIAFCEDRNVQQVEHQA